MDLVEEFTYRVTTTDSLGPTEGSALGLTQYWCVSRAELDGPRIRARLAAPGNDWMRMTSDGFWRPHVRAPFTTEDGALVLMNYTGLVEQTDTFQRAATSNSATDFDDQYMRLAMSFDTGDERYAWLTRSLFVAQGRLLGTGAIEYQVSRIT